MGLGAVKEAVLGAAIVKVVGKDELLEMAFRVAFRVEKTAWRLEDRAGIQVCHSISGTGFCFHPTRASWVEISQVLAREADERPQG